MENALRAYSPAISAGSLGLLCKEYWRRLSSDENHPMFVGKSTKGWYAAADYDYEEDSFFEPGDAIQYAFGIFIVWFMQSGLGSCPNILRIVAKVFTAYTFCADKQGKAYKEFTDTVQHLQLVESFKGQPDKLHQAACIYEQRKQQTRWQTQSDDWHNYWNWPAWLYWSDGASRADNGHSSNNHFVSPRSQTNTRVGRQRGRTNAR